jgi:hypothetical protein
MPKLAVIRPRLCINKAALFGRLTSLRQNILSSIKVMASKKDEGEQENKQERFYSCL